MILRELLYHPTEANIECFMQSHMETMDFYTLYDVIDQELASENIWKHTSLISLAYLLMELGGAYTHEKYDNSQLFYQSELLHLLVRSHQKYGASISYQDIPDKAQKDENVALLWLFLIPRTMEYQKRWYIPNGHELTNFYGIQCLEVMTNILKIWHIMGHDSSSLGLYAEEVVMGCYLAWLHNVGDDSTRHTIYKTCGKLVEYMDKESIFACVIRGYLTLMTRTSNQPLSTKDYDFITHYVLPYRPFFKGLIH